MQQMLAMQATNASGAQAGYQMYGTAYSFVQRKHSVQSSVTIAKTEPKIVLQNTFHALGEERIEAMRENKNDCQ